MHARSVRQPGVHDGPVFINLPPHKLRHVMHSREQLVFTTEAGIGFIELAAAFDVDLVEPIDHHFRDRIVFEKLTYRTEEVIETGLENCFACHG